MNGDRVSVAHQHIAACVNTELRKIGRRRIRLLDIGCGDCTLMRLLEAKLPKLKPGLELELHGFDVSDARVQAAEYRPAHRNAKFIRSSDPWPYDCGYFDIAVSNQVLEHVHDHE